MMKFFEQGATRMVEVGPMRIVTTPDEFASLSQQGWGLVFCYQADEIAESARVVPKPEQALGAPPVAGGVWIGGQYRDVPAGYAVAQESVVVKRQYFVFQQGVEEALTEARQRAEEQLERENEVRELNAQVTRARDQLARELDAAEHALGIARASGASLQARLKNAEAKVVVMEEALGKVREAIGDIEMRAIIGEITPPGR